MHYDIVMIAGSQGSGLSRRGIMRLHPPIGPIALDCLTAVLKGLC